MLKRALTVFMSLAWVLNISLVVCQASEPNRFGLFFPGSNAHLVPASGVTSVRVILDWYTAQPARNRFIPQLKLDAAVRSQKHDGARDLVVTLRCNSTWAVEFPVDVEGTDNYHKKSSMPLDMDDWRNFVRTLVERYDGDGFEDALGLHKPIKYWQLENEVLAQWNGTSEQFIELAKATRDTIRAADPTAKLISPGITAVKFFALHDGQNERGWVYAGYSDESQRRVTRRDLRRAPMLEGLYQKVVNLLRQLEPIVDIFDIHIYGSDLDDMRYQVAWMATQLRKINSSKPIWSLEFATPFFDFSKDEFNTTVITAPVVGFANGLDRIFWGSLTPATAGWSDNYVRLSLVDTEGRIKIAFSRFATAARNLEGFTSVVREPRGEGIHLYRFKFSPHREPVWVGWSESGKQTIELGDHTISVDRDPVFVVAFPQ